MIEDVLQKSKLILAWIKNRDLVKTPPVIKKTLIVFELYLFIHLDIVFTLESNITSII